MSSTSSHSLWNYDVFLSFCGMDTRNTFVSHLYRELDRLGINTFKDDEKLERGRYINDQLYKAIEDSKIAIIIISKNYVFSSFCMQELTKIMGCRENGSLIAQPIFYDVDPSNIRKSDGILSHALKKHQKQSSEDVNKWEDAMKQAVNIVGDDLKNWNDDAELIQKILEDVNLKLNRTLPRVYDQLVGMGAHMELLLPLLSMESKEEVRMIGMCGMGGIGKTTIARYLFAMFCDEFQSFCFMENIKELHQKKGKRYLQKTFLSQILQTKKMPMPSCVEGSTIIKERLRHRKVLIILDNVDKRDQLDCLVGDINWFGPGSRIIITSREKELLSELLVYDVRYLNQDDSVKLFRQHACKGRPMRDEISQLSVRAAKYACGLPLALKVWGSNLYGKDSADWEIAMFELETNFPWDIMSVLKVSYDGLEEKAKDIFLYIACYFQGGNIHRLETILNFMYGNVGYWIRVLVSRSLLEFTSENDVKVHDLLKKMGMEIVSQYSKRPGKRKFLFDSTEVVDVLEYATGTETVEAICLNTCEINAFSLHKKAFKKMHKLRCVRFHGKWDEEDSKVHVQKLDYLPPKLVHLEWTAFPLPNLPMKFYPTFLVELCMPYSNLERLWDEPMPLWNLKILDLGGSKKLKQCPDLSMAPNLEDLWIDRCSALVEVSSSIKDLQRLVSVHVADCRMLMRLPSCRNTIALLRLNLPQCHSFNLFPEAPHGIAELNLSYTGIEEVPSSVGLLSNLKVLDMSYSKVRRIASEIGNLSRLCFLFLKGCDQLLSIPESIQEMESLADLVLNECTMIRSLPELPHSIQRVDASGCLSLQIRNTLTISPAKRYKREWVVNSGWHQFPYIHCEMVQMKPCRWKLHIHMQVPQNYRVVGLLLSYSRVAAYHLQKSRLVFIGNNHVVGHFQHAKESSVIKYNLPWMPTNAIDIRVRPVLLEDTIREEERRTLGAIIRPEDLLYGRADAQNPTGEMEVPEESDHAVERKEKRRIEIEEETRAASKARKTE